MKTKIMIETAPELLDHPRTDTFDALTLWLSKSGAISGLPPTEVIVELTAGDLVDPVLADDDAVGVFLVFDRYTNRLTDEFRVVLAMGRETDEYDWINRLAGVVHELIHVAQFWQLAHCVPATAPPATLQRWRKTFSSGRLEDNTEAQARHITAVFLKAQPQWRRVPAAS